MCVLIPDTWGKSSDKFFMLNKEIVVVLIPDTWGKSSDNGASLNCWHVTRLNPRYVGQVFRLIIIAFAIFMFKS